jgi:hypothetical protein
MHWNILKIGAVQFLLVMSSLLAAAASPVKLPEWAVNLEDGEYLGVSFPGGGQRQAEAMALMAMYDMNYKLGENARLIVNNEFSYDVKNVELLSSGETVVVLVDGESVSRNVKMVKEIYSSEVAVKCEMAIRVEGQWEMYVNIYKIKNNYNLACKWSDYMETEPGLWVHDGEKGAVNQNMCDKIELRPYTVAGSHIGNDGTFDSVVEIEAGKYFLSESMLINEVEQPGLLLLASISFQKDKQVFSFRAPVYSAWRDKGVRRALNDLTPGEVDEAKYIDSLTTALRQYYIRSVSAGIQDRNSQSILYYNSEKEMFLIRDAHFGYVSVPVPEEDHGAFEKKFDALKREYEYDIADDRLALISVTYTTTDGRTYRSSDVSGS